MLKKLSKNEAFLTINKTSAKIISKKEEGERAISELKLVVAERELKKRRNEK